MKCFNLTPRAHLFTMYGRWFAVLSDVRGVLAADVRQLHRNTSASIYLLL